jgi:single-stranded DNA-binding protein
MRNYLQLIGRLTKDPEFKKVGEHDLANCSMAYNKNKDQSFFIDINAWRDSAEKLMQYKKGELVIVSGELDVQSYTVEGNSKTKAVLVLKFIQLVLYKQKQNDSPEVF